MYGACAAQCGRRSSVVTHRETQSDDDDDDDCIPSPSFVRARTHGRTRGLGDVNEDDDDDEDDGRRRASGIGGVTMRAVGGCRAVRARVVRGVVHPRTTRTGVLATGVRTTVTVATAGPQSRWLRWMRGGGMTTASAAATEPSSTTMRSSVTTVLGTMTFGWAYSSEKCEDDAARAMLERFALSGFHEVDTALAYAGGETEKILGRALRATTSNSFRVATKANPWPGGKMTSSAGLGGLDPREFRAQVRQSLASLGEGVDVHVLYLHAPDAGTRLVDVLREAEAMRVEGAFEELGLSNFSAWEVVKAHEICTERGWKKPTIYQGMYNALTRNVEPELIPALKATNMRFVAYNPLCGGLLTGKYASTRDVKDVSGGRFDGNDMYTSRFWLDVYHDAVADIASACRAHDIAPADASLRWLYNHSMLDGSKGDGVIIGASSLAQLDANLASATNAEPLPKDVLDAFDAGWAKCKSSAAPYFRGHFLLS